MYMTATVLNAGLGDLTLGLQSAGFQIDAAYEAEQAAVEIHRANIDVPIFLLQSEKFEPRTISSSDLLAARLYSPRLSASDGMRTYNYCDIIARYFLKLLRFHRPKAFLLALNAAFIKGQYKEIFLSEIAGVNFQYKYIYQLTDIAGMTGMPTAERMVFVVGTRLDIYEDFHFPETGQLTPMPLEAYLQSEDQIDSWYFNSLKPDQIPIERNKNRVYCWDKNQYVGTDRVRWNYRKIPLVDTGETFRKMTHREIANLKGFPASYDLSASMSRSRLYQKLVYTVNVQAVAKLAGNLARSMAEHPQWNPSIDKAIQFKNLFGRYLSALKVQMGRNWTVFEQECDFDFALRHSHQRLYIELNYSRSRFIPSLKIEKFCKLLRARSKDGEMLLVLASEVSENFKQECWKQFHIHIWDIKNLLWLFSEFEEIRSEFVALSDYATGDILPVPPEFVPNFIAQEYIPEVLEEKPAALETVSEPFTETAYEEEEKAHTETVSWKERLSRIDPGDDHSREYERFCVDFLKCILTDYFSLWEEQEQTNDGLHRFDLCCKIKNGVNQDFFNTISHHYNTKYVVFEFKNYSKEITQKEIYTTEKYLYKTALRQVAIIISRRGCDSHAMQAAKGSLRESGKLILCLSDQDLLKMADMWKSGDPEPAQLLSDKLDNLLIHLEK